MSFDFKKCFTCNNDMRIDPEKVIMDEKDVRYFCSDNCFLLYTIKGEHPDDTGAIIYPQSEVIEDRFELLDL
jgi:hypothetical protein